MQRKNSEIRSPGDAAALARALVDVFLDPMTAAAIGAAARRQVEERFSWSRAVEETIVVYREVLQ